MNFKLKSILTVLVVLFLFQSTSKAQAAREVAVEIKANLTSKNFLQLNWLQQNGSTKYEVFKKSSNGKSWDLLATLNGADTFWIDTNYIVGKAIEYRVSRSSSNYTGFNGNGYILAGFNIPEKKQLGKILVIIDSTYARVLSGEIEHYLTQIRMEGFDVMDYWVNRNTSAPTIKNWIYNQWKADSNSIKSIFLLGRVAVPYSGNYRPDGHSEHIGAWPADLYYGNFYSNWSDNTVNNTQASRSENDNVPNDGKFDLSRYNTLATQSNQIQYQQIPVGRVDLSNMPAFGNDTFLLKRYLTKSLAFRSGSMKFENKGLIDDNLGYFGSEAFSSSGFRNISTFSRSNISTDDYRTKLSGSRYLLSYGCGIGTYTSANGVSSSSDFVNDSLLNPITMTFGSYFGDWDNENNFLRAPLASKGWGLVSVWSGRPYWVMHECALGYPLYKGVLSTKNAFNVYNTAAMVSGVHVALMGDPTLRAFVVDNFYRTNTSSTCNSELELKWKKSSYVDSVLLEIFDSKSNDWKALNSKTGADSALKIKLPRGSHLFSIRNKQLMESASGTWWQLGARDTFSLFIDSFPTSRIVGDILSAYCVNQTYWFYDSSDFSRGETSSWHTTGMKYDTVSNSTNYSVSYGIGGIKDFLILNRWSKTGCYFGDTIILNINPVHINIISSVDTVCYGSDLSFGFGKHIHSPQWYINDTLIGTDSVLYFNGQPTGAYYLKLKGKDQDNCSVQGLDTFKILDKPLKPVIQVVKNMGRVGDTVEVIVMQKADFYEYYWNGKTQSSNNNKLRFVVDEPGIVKVECKLKNSNGCVSDTSAVQFEFVINSNLKFIALNLKYYPNPAKSGEEINLELPELISPEKDDEIIWVDMFGMTVAQQKLTLKEYALRSKDSGQLKLTLPQVKTGVYSLVWNGQVLGKMMILND